MSIVYGGTGSASMDTSRADNLKTALEKSGISVNDALWNFYSKEEGSRFERVEGGLVPVVLETGEAPWEIYPELVKYYETRYEDFVMGNGNAGEFDYSSTVAFPFGHGLSYTKFAYSDMSVNYNTRSDQYEVSVTVTNVGNMAGKETFRFMFRVRIRSMM